MFKVKINSIKNSELKWEASFPTLAEAETWLTKQKLKPNRQDVREITIEASDPAPSDSIILEEYTEMDVDYKRLQLPAEATYEIEDITSEYNNTQVIQNRLNEYPSVEELIHVIADHGLESQEWLDLMAARQAIKDKYPKS